MCDKPYTSSDKIVVSAISGLVFLLISSPYTYSLTDKLASMFGMREAIADSQGCPKLVGLLIHAAVFVLIIRLMMNRSGSAGCYKPYSSKDKWIAALIGGLLFLLMSSPFLYEAFNTLTKKVGIKISSEDGCPNIGGLLLHSVAFASVTRLLMR